VKVVGGMEQVVALLPRFTATTSDLAHSNDHPYTPAMPEQLNRGDSFGQYDIVRLLGRGGMGEVYEARHRVLKRSYALKLLPPGFQDNPDALERFQREAEVMANLEHPNIIKVDEFGENDDRYWLRMELAVGLENDECRMPDGEKVVSLQDLADARGGRIEQEELLPILEQVLQGLEYAHSHGAIHRDLKPSNILLFPSTHPPIRSPTAKISDFGLVRMVGEDWLRSQAELSVQQSMSLGERGTQALGDAGTSTRSLLGTYEYMSPEQRKGQDVDAKSDIYSIGVLIYRLLTGEAIMGYPRPPTKLVDGLNRAWDELVADCLQADPAERPPSAQALRTRLPIEQKVEQQPAHGNSAPSPGAPSPRNQPRLRSEREDAPRAERRTEERKPPSSPQQDPGGGWKKWVGVLVVLAVLAMIAVAAYFQQSGKARPVPKTAVRTETVSPTPPPRKQTTTSSAPTPRSHQSTIQTPAAPQPGESWRITRLGMEFLPIGPGSFQMGSDDGDSYEWEKPVHTVRIGYDFWLGKTEVTQSEYKAVMRKNPSYFKGDKNPVDTVSWNDAVAFCGKLTVRERAAGRIPEGWAYRLPTEAEWEYAARGGTKSKGFKYAGSSSPGEVAWFEDNSENKTHAVAQKIPNELGLHDMSGNVWEWCEDVWGDSYQGTPTDGSAQISGGSDRVHRGGSWFPSARYVRSTIRSRYPPSYSYLYLGFRVCLGRSR
jgi:formylglycine-generating enzyme required for sulfatase activity